MGIRFLSHCNHMLLKRSVSVKMRVHNLVVPSLRGVKVRPRRITSSNVFPAMFTLVFQESDVECPWPQCPCSTQEGHIVCSCRELPASLQAPPRSPKNNFHVSWKRQDLNCFRQFPKHGLQQRTTQSGTHLGRVHRQRVLSTGANRLIGLHEKEIPTLSGALKTPSRIRDG